MIINTRRYGDIKIDPAKIITFNDGVIGFGRNTRYVLIPFAEGTPFELLQAVDDSNLAFVVINPALLVPEYKIDISGDDLESIQVKNVADVALRVIVTLPMELSQMTANLQGPILINEARLLGKQIVLVNSDYHLRHPVLSVA
ncbi:MAG: flagellar assembly protein FliW [Nitrospinae bacterium]|nr:flagellar assembly protein FliW [Nitrospinota bacterium]